MLSDKQKSDTLTYGIRKYLASIYVKYEGVHFFLSI
jgi:hypothetical protein